MNIIEETGYLLKVLIGSKRFGLDLDDSDTDYLIVVDPRVEYPVKPVPGGYATYNIPEEQVEYFILPLDRYRDIRTSAAGLSVPSYMTDILGGSSELLISFWTEHKAALCNIDPIVTYKTTLDTVSFYVDNGYKNAYAMAVRMLGILEQGYQQQDISKAFDLSAEWKDRYYQAKRGDMDFKTLRGLYKNVTTQVKDWYLGQSPNTSLQDQYTRLIDQLLG